MVFCCISPIVLTIGLKVHALPCKVLASGLVPVTPPQHFGLLCVVEFNVSRVIFRFLVTDGAGMVLSDFIVATETIPVWFSSFKPVFPILVLLVGLSCIMCTRCATPQCFYNVEEHEVFTVGFLEVPGE